MSKKADLVFPEFNIALTGTFLEAEEPELCQRLWEMLPLEALCVHTLSTGSLFLGRFRPPREAQRAGTQLKPLGRGAPVCLCELQPGDVSFAGDMLICAYGKITEPLPGGGPVVLRVDPACLTKFQEAGKAVWDNHVGGHRRVTLVLKRKEG